MKSIIITTTLLIGFANSYAQTNENFAKFIRTKDSLMHIAFYDKDVKGYKVQFNECLAAYNKLGSEDKKEFKDYIDDQYYCLAEACAVAGDKAGALYNLEHSDVYNYERLQKDKMLASLQKEPRFIAYLNKAKAQKPKYIALLQKNAQYNASEKKELPKFTYQPAEEQHLLALKKGFNLDSIAGNGTDVNRIINLMKWVHYMVPHDGSKGNPETKNAMSMITECRRDKKTLNCRGLATVLNEVYLAEGFKSRFITCLPKDTMDNDCHVITMVWAESLKKWVWMDPTFMAYVMNENGELLGPGEVRERLINNKTLIINPDANHNDENGETKADYLDYYMAKNLYRMECPVSSEYDYETRAASKKRAYIQLVPGVTAPPDFSAKNKDGIEVYATHYTNDPAKFWAPPAGINTVSIAPKTSSGHTQADYEGVMKEYLDCYNSNNVAKLKNMFQPGAGSWVKENFIKDDFADWGALKYYRYMGLEEDNEEEDVALFMMVYDKSTHCMAISLDKNNKIGTFRGKTYSNYIDWRLAKEIEKDKGGKK